MKRKHIIDIITVLYMFLFMYAAANKLIDYQKFVVQLGQSPMLTAFAPMVAWFIPALELIIVGLLYGSKTRLIGLYASFTLMMMFVGYIIAIKNFSEYVPCSCGGILEKLNWNQHLVFNIAFVVLAIIAILLYEEKTTNKTLQRSFQASNT